MFKHFVHQKSFTRELSPPTCAANNNCMRSSIIWPMALLRRPDATVHLYPPKCNGEIASNFEID